MATHITKVIRPVIDRLTPRLDPGTAAEDLVRFTRDRDEAAFSNLIRRFGPLVMGVCRRVLGNRPDVDDAFQATFWVLARRADSIRNPQTLPAWLHAVALRTARRALHRIAPVANPVAEPVASDDPLADASWREVRQRLDEEVGRLPHRLRLPILLCYFEELTRDEAAEQLGWSLSTLKRRLETARERLKIRLMRRGIGPGLLGATTLLSGPLTARVPPTLESATAQLTSRFPSATVRALAATAPGLKTWLTAAVAIAGLGLGIATVMRLGAAPTPMDPPAKDAPSAKTTDKSAPKKEDTVAESLPPRAVARIGNMRYRAPQAFWFGSFSEDGRWLASGTDGVEIWDLQTGMPRQIMPVRNNTVPRPTLSPDGTLVAVLDGGPGIHLFDRASGKELRTLGDKESFNQCRFTPDGQRVVGVRNRDTPIAIGFDLDGKELFRREPEGTQIGEWDRRLVFYAIVPGAAVAEKPGSITLRVVDVETGKELRKFETTADDYYVEPQDKGFRTGLRDSTLSQNRIAIAPDQSSIAYLRADRSLGILSLTPGSKPRAAELPEQFIPGRIWYGPDGKNLFASNWGGAIVRINPADGKRITTFSGHGNGVGQWHVDAEGKVMTTTGQDGLIARWDLTTNKEIPLATGGFRSQVRVAITADGKRVIAGDRGGIIEVCSAEGKPLYSIPGSDSEWTTFALSPDGRTLVVTRAQSTLLWWDLVAGKELAKSTIPGPIPDQLFKSIHEMAFTPDGRRLICSYQNATLVALDTETRKELWRVGPPTDKDYDSSVGLAVSSDGRHIARGLRRGVRTGDWGYGLQIVDSATGEALKNIDVSEQRQSYGLPSLSEIRYTSDGRYLILLSINGHVQVRYADTLAEFASFTTGAKHAGALNVSPDGRTIVTGDDTGGTKLWETLTGKLIATVSGHRGGVYSTAISPNGPYLVTGGVDRVAYVWKLKPTTPLTAKAIEQLSSDDAAAAREAIWTLAADPDGPKKLREHIKPFEHPKPDAIQGLIADLDHPMFARREEASKALSDLGVFVEPAIRKALSEKPTAEARERLEKVRKGIDRKPTRIDLLHSRAVHAVELANTEAARKVLEEWAGGAAGAWLTVDAKAALERLRRMK